MNNWNNSQQGPVMHYEPPKKKGVPTWVHVICYIAVAVLSLGIGVGLAATDNTATETVENSTPAPTATTSTKPSVTPKQAAAEKPKSAEVTITSGFYEVGKDVKAGKYKSKNNDSLCYWARTSSLEDEMAIKANHLGGGDLVVVIKPTDKGFKTSGCNVWVLQK